MSLLGSHYVVEEDYYGPGIREERVVDVYDEVLPVDRYPGRLGGYAEDDLYLARREARLAEDEARVAAEEANLALQHSIYNNERVAASSVDYGLGVMDGWDYYGYGDDFRGIYGYGNYGRLDAAELGLRKAEEEELWALRDLRMYEDALRLDKALSEQERLLRWRNRLDWEELAEEERQLRWERMDQAERELLGLAAEGFWGRRYGRYNYYDGRSYNHSTHPNYASSAFEAWAHDVGPHGGTGSYADRHPEIPDSNAYPGRNYPTRYGGYGDYRVPDRTQLEILYGRSGVYSRGHYPLSKRLSDKYGNVLSTFASRRTVY